MTKSGNPEEDRRREELRLILAESNEFDVYEEVTIRHALFTHRTVRADLLAVPRDPLFRQGAIAFEVKGHSEWLIPTLTHALKQAADYVLGKIEPHQDAILEEHWGKRVLAAFVYPALSARNKKEGVDSTTAFLMGMMQFAGAHRVGAACVSDEYREKPLVLSISSSPLWISSRGWRADTLPLLMGNRQIGSGKFGILDELQRMDAEAGK